MDKENHYPFLFKARTLRRKDATFFTMREMLDLLQTLAESSIGDEVKNQMGRDIVTEPYYDCISTWLDTRQWCCDENTLRVMLSFLEKPRRKDKIALSTHKIYGRSLRLLVKTNALPLPVRRMLYARLALSEAIWRVRHPNPSSSDLNEFLREEMEKLQRAFDVPE